MTDKDKIIQEQFDRGVVNNATDPDVATYRVLYGALCQEPSLRFSDAFAERVAAQVKPATSSSRWSAGLMIACIVAALLASGLVIHRIDAVVFSKLTTWMLFHKELIGFGVGMLAVIQLMDRWLMRNVR